MGTLELDAENEEANELAASRSCLGFGAGHMRNRGEIVRNRIISTFIAFKLFYMLFEDRHILRLRNHRARDGPTAIKYSRFSSSVSSSSVDL